MYLKMKKKTRPGSSNKYSHLSRIRFFPSLAQYPPERGFLTGFVLAVVTVSYTHLDVYKRQGREES